MKKKDKKKTTENTDGKIVFYTQEIKKNKAINEDTVKAISFIVILIIVTGLFIGLFFLNRKYISKDDQQKESTTTTTTTTAVTYNPNQVTVDTMFGIDKKNTYYVLAYDKDDELNGEYLYNKASSANLDNIKVYTLDLKNAMNKAYYNTDKDENTKPTKAKEVNFKTNTLIVFKKGKVAEYITEKDKIVEKLTKK